MQTIFLKGKKDLCDKLPASTVKKTSNNPHRKLTAETKSFYAESVESREPRLNRCRSYPAFGSVQQGMSQS